MAFDLPTYQSLIQDVDNATNNNEKGAAFEDLCEYLFSCLEGVDVVERDARMASEEIDLVLWNAQIEDELRSWDDVILVECKNWSTHVGAIHLNHFISKMERRDRKTGVFIAANGITGTYIQGDGNNAGAVEIIKDSLRKGIKVITIVMDDLRGISTKDEFKELIKLRYCKLFINKVL